MGSGINAGDALYFFTPANLQKMIPYW